MYICRCTRFIRGQYLLQMMFDAWLQYTLYHQEDLIELNVYGLYFLIGESFVHHIYVLQFQAAFTF